MTNFFQRVTYFAVTKGVTIGVTFFVTFCVTHRVTYDVTKRKRSLRPKPQGRWKTMKNDLSIGDDFVEVAFDEVGHAVFGEGGGDF